jgi:hypothetical protein
MRGRDEQEAKTARLGQSSKGAFRMLGRSDNEILVHVVRAYREIGEDSFTVLRYQRWRQATIECEDEPLPSLGQLRSRYGSMTEALHRAVPDAPRRNLRLAAPMRVALDEATTHYAAREPTTDVGTTQELAQPLAMTNTNHDAAFEVLDPLTAMARALTRDELREFEQAARRRVYKLAGLKTSVWAERLRPLTLLLEREGVEDSVLLRVERKRYNECRPADAPSSERLVRAYGSWAAVCRAAAGVTADGRRRRVGTNASRSPRGRRGTPYTRADVIAAVRLCAEELGCVPSSHRYIVWQRHKRTQARGRGMALRLPHYDAVRRLFHNGNNGNAWDAVKAAAFPAAPS